MLNPQLPTIGTGERGAEVDLLVRFDAGRSVHIEIQVAREDGFVARTLAYWARALTRQLSPGDDFARLTPTGASSFSTHCEQ